MPKRNAMSEVSGDQESGRDERCSKRVQCQKARKVVQKSSAKGASHTGKGVKQVGMHR